MEFPFIEELFKSTKRVLRPNGLMVIVTALPSIKDVEWYLKLSPGLTDRYIKILPNIEQFLTMFETSGFECFAKFNLLGCDWLKHYYNAEFPLRKDLRKGVSWFGMATDNELQEIESTVRNLKEKGKLEEFLKNNDKALDVGVFTVIACASD